MAKTFIKKFRKEIKYESIIRIIDAAEGTFRLDEHLKQQSNNLMDKIIELCQCECDELEIQEAEQLITEINKFNMLTRSYKAHRKVKNDKCGRIDHENGHHEHEEVEKDVDSSDVEMEMEINENKYSNQSISQINHKSVDMLKEALEEVQQEVLSDEVQPVYEDEGNKNNGNLHYVEEIFDEVCSPLEEELHF